MPQGVTVTADICDTLHDRHSLRNECVCVYLSVYYFQFVFMCVIQS